MSTSSYPTAAMPYHTACSSPVMAQRVHASPVRRILTATIIAASIGCTPGASPDAALNRLDDRTVESFHKTAEAHVTAMVGRDLDGLLATITTGDSLPVIFPEGQIIYTREQYVDFHRDWFADSTWQMQVEPVTHVVREGVGVALYRGTYTDVRGSREQLVALTFAHEDGEWRLVFDQNTRIPEEPSGS